MSLFPEGNGLNKNHRDDPGIWSTTPEFGSKRTPHLRSTVPNAQRHMAYFAGVYADISCNCQKDVGPPCILSVWCPSSSSSSTSIVLEVVCSCWVGNTTLYSVVLPIRQLV